MRNIVTYLLILRYVFIICLIIIESGVIAQNRTHYHHQFDSLQRTYLQPQTRFDTIWVVDSSQLFSRSTNDLIQERNYKVITRNGQGNPTSTLDTKVDGFPYYTYPNAHDSMVYFDGVELQKKHSNVWNSVEQQWILNKLEEYDAPDLRRDYWNKNFNDNTQQYDGWRIRYFNRNGHPDTVINYTYVPETDDWSPKSMTLHFYNQQENDTLMLIYQRVGNQWEDSIRYFGQFSENKLVLSIGERFNKETQLWEARYLTSFHYTESGLRDTLTYQSWDVSQNKWRDNFKYVYTYDAFDRLTNFLTMQYSYVALQLLNYNNVSYVFSENEMTELYQTWNNLDSVWVNQMRTYTSYAFDDVVDTVQNDFWNYQNQVWQPNDRLINELDNRYNILSSEQWYMEFSDWVLENKVNYFWSPFMPNAIVETLHRLSFDVYPNPSASKVNFNCSKGSIPIEDGATISIFSVSGKKVAEIPILSGHANWDCTGVSPGLYTYRLIMDSKSVSGKILVK